MKHTTEWKTFQNQTHFVQLWTPKSPLQGKLYMIHGMAEHSQNYCSTAEYFVSKGYQVMISDLIGHGQTQHQKGSFQPNDWQNMITSQIHLLEDFYRTSEYPTFLLGHSMGSFIAQEIAIQFPSKLAGLILVGSTYEPPLKMKCLALMSHLLNRVWGGHKPGHFYFNQTFKKYQKKFPQAPSPFSWLSTHQSFVNDYEKDPLCGQLLNNQFYEELFKGLLSCYSKNVKMPYSYPILVLSGAKDAVSNNCTTIPSLIRHLETQHTANVTCLIYRKWRHQILRETDETLVLNTIENWIEHVK